MPLSMDPSKTMHYIILFIHTLKKRWGWDGGVESEMCLHPYTDSPYIILR